MLPAMIKVFWRAEDVPRGAGVIGSCGGQPLLHLTEAPDCRLCGAPMPYFFTLDVSGVLPGRHLSLFYCVSCTGSTVPAFPATPVSRPISAAEARSLQTDYRLYLHEPERPQVEVASPLVETPVYGKASRADAYGGSKIGGTPTKYWGAADGNIHRLLLQIRALDDVVFPRRPGTPRQQAYKLLSDDPEFHDAEHYRLVNGIPIYIFATHDEESAFLVTGRF